MKAIVVFGIVLLFAGAASGITITQSVAFAGVPNFQRTLTFDSFDVALGRLDGVRILLTLAVTDGEIVVDNESALPASLDLALVTEASLSSSEVFCPAVMASASLGRSVSLAGDDGDGVSIDPTGEDGAMVSFVGGSADDSADLLVTSGPTEATQVASFENTATGPWFNLALESGSTFAIHGAGGVAGAFTPAAVDGLVTITYSYTPAVPEPATATLMLAGTMWACLRRRKR